MLRIYSVRIETRITFMCGKLPNGTISMSRLAVERDHVWPMYANNSDEYESTEMLMNSLVLRETQVSFMCNVMCEQSWDVGNYQMIPSRYRALQ